MNTYYVYAYIRANGTPYYIGKGEGKRAWLKGKGEVGKPTDSSRIVIVENNLTNTGALAIERRLIRWYGRLDLGTGILRNKTDGGDGVAGYRYTNVQKSEISARMKGRKGKPHTEETKQKLREINLGKHSKPITEEHKRKISESNKGRIKSPEHRAKISKANVGRTPTDVERSAYLAAMEAGKTTCEHCGKIAILGNYRRWHGNNCRLKKH